MGYYFIKLGHMSYTLCTIILHWDEYEYQTLPMGLCNSQYIFQDKIDKKIQDLDYVRVCIENLLVLSNGTWEENLANLANLTNVLTKSINT